jgi:hypothetical protein
MGRHVLIPRIEVGLVAARVGDTHLGIVRNDNSWNGAHELKGVDVKINPGREILTTDRLCIGIVAGSQGSDKEKGRDNGPCLGIVNGDGIAGKIDEELFSCLVALVKGDIEGLKPCSISQAELAVLVSFGILFLVFMPEELEGDMLSREFLPDVLKGRHVPPLHIERDGGGEKEVLKGGVVQIFRNRPGQACSFCPVEILPNGGSSDIAA